MIHELKCWPDRFKDIFNGNKTFEYRRNDRGYAIGDLLLLKEYHPHQGRCTGEEICVQVCYVLDGKVAPPEFGLPEDYCIMGIQV